MSGRSLVDGYLAELASAADGLPGGRGPELVAEVREHIETALAASTTSDEATVRNVLERLGPPSEIVAAERDGDGPPSPATPARPRSALTPARIAIAALAVVLVLMLAGMFGTSGPGAALMALAFAVVTPYVWIPLVVGLLALALRRDRSPVASAAAGAGPVARRRPSPSLVGLGAIVALLIVVLLTQGAGSMGWVAGMMVPVLALLLVVEVLGRRAR